MQGDAVTNLTGAQPASPITIWTVGHSTRSSEEFNNILKAHRIRSLVDVRSFPGSRRYPHFNKENLSVALSSTDVAYHHLPELGGRRAPRKDSRNTAWRNSGFRGYADYMEGPEFRKGVEVLLEIGRQTRTAVMCAEAVWWRCHRSLIADFLKAGGAEVIHILDAKKSEPHPYTSAARVINGRLSYEGLLDG